MAAYGQNSSNFVLRDTPKGSTPVASAPLLLFSGKQNSFLTTYLNKIAQQKFMVLVCGIDEAGRGPVIGPLVIAGVVLDETEFHKLQQIGVKDSKLLSPSTRERLFDQIKQIAPQHHIISLSPSQVDAAVLAKTQNNNLNWLEATTSSEIINVLQPEKAIVDCPSNNLTAYTRFVRDRLRNKGIFLVCEHKADVNYVICGAASILAKVTRDRAIEDLKKQIGVDFGSGYVTDPKTVAFLQEYWDKIDVFRKSWESWQRFARNT